MSKKTDYILEQMIKAYLNEQNPIGSMLLQDSLNVPASTIRVYFKQLDSDGYISKLHASGGRIPTQKAMKYYWHQFFNYTFNTELEINSSLELLKVASENDLFCLVVDNNKVFLNEVLNIDNRFIILDFSQKQVLINFNDELNVLFNQIKGYEINDIKTILYRLNLLNILDEIENAFKNKIKFICGEKIFANIVKLSSFSSIMNAKLLDYFTSSLIYDELFLPEYMGVKIDCNFKQNKSTLVLAGSIFTDYENVLNQLREAI
ncbi:hypothetical protein AVANS14531_06770 [Campylobacter sp. Cr9]|uniref:hypothetical protein n=1 Tax=Campylobacter sp. Cr9 TaxID=2735728 RepID=UPI0030144CF8|nr:hypothetical protein [Campylobacter sp. Cr9]